MPAKKLTAADAFDAYEELLMHTAPPFTSFKRQDDGVVALFRGEDLGGYMAGAGFDKLQASARAANQAFIQEREASIATA